MGPGPLMVPGSSLGPVLGHALSAPFPGICENPVLDRCPDNLEITLQEFDEVAGERLLGRQSPTPLPRQKDPKRRTPRSAQNRPETPAPEVPLPQGNTSAPTGAGAVPERRFESADRGVRHPKRYRMMGNTKRGRRTYSAGEWGRNRVRVFLDPRTGIMQVEWRDHGRKLRRSLKHRDWARAKRQADEIAAGLAEPVAAGATEAEPEPLTLDRLFDTYGDEVTPTKSKRSRTHDRAAMTRFLRFFGGHRRAETLSQRDWDRFIRARRAGQAGGSRKPVSDRTIESDLRFLLAVLNWAAKSRDEEGRLLLGSNPLRGLKLPKEKNPIRVMLTQAEYEALLRVAGRRELAVSGGARACPRDGAPYRGDPSAQVV